MKALVLLITLLFITLANSATLKDRNEGLEPSKTIFSEATVREKKAPAISNIKRNHDAENTELSTDSSFTNGLSVSLPEERSLSGFKKPIIIKKKVGYKVYRNSDEEQAQAHTKENCRKQVKVKLCEDESESNSNQMRQDLQLDPMSSFEMEHSIKMAKEAVENFQRDLRVMERSSTMSGPKEHSQTDADTELHKDIEVARQVLEHIHNNFGNLQSMRVHATTLNDEDISNIESEKTRKVNWEERIHNIQKNMDAGKNIEDRFLVERKNNNDAEIQEDIDLHKIVQQNDPAKISGNIALDRANEENTEMSITKDINSNTKLHSENLKLERNSNVLVTPQKREHALSLKSTDSLIGTDQNNIETMSDDNTHLKEKNSENSHSSLYTDMKAAENILKNLRIKEENTHKSTNIDRSDDGNLRFDDDSSVINKELNEQLKTENNLAKNVMNEKSATKLNDNMAINTEKEKLQHMKAVENTKGKIMNFPFDDHPQLRIPIEETTNNFEVEHIQNPHVHLERNDESNMLLHQPLKENTPNEFSEMRWGGNDVQKFHNMKNDESSKDEHLEKTSFVEHSHQIPSMRRTSHSNLHVENGQMQINSALHELRNHEGQLTNGQYPHELNNRPTLRVGTEFGKESSMDGHHNFNVPSAHHVASEMIPVNAMFHHGKNVVMDNIVQASQHMPMREALEAEYAQQWFNKHGMSRGSNYMQQPSNVPATATSSYGSTSSGTIGLFPNANTGGCAIPLLLSCSPSVVSGTLAKGHSSYSAPSYRSMDEFRYHNKRETHNEDKNLVNKNYPTVITKVKVQPDTNKTP